MDEQNNNNPRLMSFEEIYAKCKSTFEKYEKWRILALIFLTISESGFCYGLYQLFLHERNARFLRHALIIFALMYLLWMGVKKLIEYNVKSEVMHSFVENFGEITWDTEDYLEYDRVKNSKIFPDCKKGNFLTEDNIYGKYNDSDFLITRLTLYRSFFWVPQITFEGTVVQMLLKKDVNADILVVEKNFMPITPLKKTALEDPEWNNNFDIYTNDPIEARYFLTTSLMESIKDIKSKYNAKRIHLAVENNVLMIALNIGPEALSTCGLLQPLKKKEIWHRLYNQISAILQLNDTFNNKML